MKELTGSNSWVAAVNLATFIPIIFFVLYAGSLADRFDRRKLIIVTQVVMMFAALGLAVTTSLGDPSLASIIAITVAMGIAFVFNFPAWRALVPDLVPARDLLNGVALDAAQFNMARFVGPALGALILNLWNVSGAFYVNAASFLTVIAALMLIKTRPSPAVAPPGGTRAHIIDGARYLRENRWAANLLSVIGISAFFGIAAVVLLPAFAKDVLGGGSWDYGCLMGAIGLGAVTGAPLVTRLSRRFKERDIIKGSILAFSFILFGLALSRTYWLTLTMTFLIGVSYLMASASINTVLQSRVERNMRGRIMSFYILFFQGISPIGGLLMGSLSDRTSAPVAVAVGGGACLLLAVFIIAVPSFLSGAVSPGRS